MGLAHSSVQNVVVLVDLPADALQKLKERFQTVHYLPGDVGFGRDGHGVRQDVFEKIDGEVWERVELLIVRRIPPQLTDRAKQAPNLKWIQTTSAGVEWIFKAPLIKNEPKGSDLLVTSSSGIHAISISQHVFGLLLVLSQQLDRFIVAQKIDQSWYPRSSLPNGGLFIPDLRDKKIGILGYGGIGREVGRVAQGWGLEVLACNSDGKRKPETAYTIDGCGDPEGKIPSSWYASKDEASLRSFFANSDVLVVAAPLSPATRHIVDRKALELLGPKGVLINIARGELVDQDALIEALDSDAIAGAGLDVTTPEPLPDGHPLFTAKNCIITPHISGNTVKYMTRLVDVVLTNDERLKKGQEPYNRVRLDRGY